MDDVKWIDQDDLFIAAPSANLKKNFFSMIDNVFGGHPSFVNRDKELLFGRMLERDQFVENQFEKFDFERQESNDQQCDARDAYD